MMAFANKFAKMAKSSLQEHNFPSKINIFAALNRKISSKRGFLPASSEKEKLFLSQNVKILNFYESESFEIKPSKAFPMILVWYIVIYFILGMFQILNIQIKVYTAELLFEIFLNTFKLFL